MSLSTFGVVSPQASKKVFETTVDLDSEKGSFEEVNLREGYKAHNLPLQVYTHYAKVQRDLEQSEDFDKLYAVQLEQMRTEGHANISQSKLDSQRQLRAARLYSVFFLITTDILGPMNAPYAVAHMGYVPGVILYVLFGIFAAIGGYMLNRAYVKVDSNNYPVRTFSDLAARTMGAWFRYPSAILQFIQMIMNVGLLLLSTATSVAQVIKQYQGHVALCFTVNILAWGIFGMLVGQIKTLYRFSHLANFAVWMNIAVVVMTMVSSATSTPNYEVFWSQNGTDWPYNTTQILKYAITPGTLSSRIQGMNNMVFAWGGATIFCEVMAELRRPMDFWKGMICAQVLILVLYLFFGVFVYSYWGQWCMNPANLGISTAGLQTACNILGIVSNLLAAVLYGNVGLKVLYQGFFVAEFRWPALTTMKGTLIWGVAVVIYWAVAFIIGTAVPSIGALVSIIGAFCILNFSYTFPFMFNLVLSIREDAGSADRFDLNSATVIKSDTWMSASRWKRGLLLGSWKRSGQKLVMLLLTLAALVTCGLCSYSAVEGAIDAYKVNTATSFGCASNV